MNIEKLYSDIEKKILILNYEINLGKLKDDKFLHFGGEQRMFAYQDVLISLKIILDSNINNTNQIHEDLLSIEKKLIKQKPKRFTDYASYKRNNV